MQSLFSNTCSFLSIVQFSHLSVEGSLLKLIPIRNLFCMSIHRCQVLVCASSLIDPAPTTRLPATLYIRLSSSGYNNQFQSFAPHSICYFLINCPHPLIKRMARPIQVIIPNDLKSYTASQIGILLLIYSFHLLRLIF